MDAFSTIISAVSGDEDGDAFASAQHPLQQNS